MVMASRDRLGAALASLDPGSRALLDLALRRRVAHEEIAGLLGTDVTSIEDRIELVLTEVAADADSGVAEVRADLAGLGPDAWAGMAPGSEPAESPATDEPESAPAEEAAPETDERAVLPAYPEEARTDGRDGPSTPPMPPGPRRRRWLGPLALLVAIAAATTVVLILAADDDGPSAPPGRTNTTATSTQTAPEPESRPVRLRSLTGQGSGTARLRDEDRRLQLRVELPPLDEEYVAWLYNDVQDARRLGGLELGRSLDVDLPEDFRDYRYLEVSAEPPDDNPNHSGASVLRMPVSRLGGR